MKEQLNKMVWTIIITLLLSITVGMAADLYQESLDLQKAAAPMDSPIVPNNWKYHKIGTLWNRVTNFSYLGDDAYENRTPSCDYPGGSGNSYLYRGTLWLHGFVDGVFHSSTGEDKEFSPLDSVYLTTESTRADQETYTRYYDVYAPGASAHVPLGVEVIERTYAWSASYAGDFIIYEYTIKNVGIDTDGDYLPDTPQDIQDFYFGIRLDGDISKLPTWGAEDKYSNQDDWVMCNSQWDWLERCPQMAGYDHGLTAEDADSTLMFMLDYDNPYYPSEYIVDGVAVEDDMGNPGVDGVLQSPGFLGVKILKSVPEMKPSSFHICHIYNDPATDQEAWNRMIGVPEFEDITDFQGSGVPYPAHDYRGIYTLGPLANFPTGDSVVVTMALGVGSDPDSGGIYSMIKLVEIMKVAQFIVDNDYVLAVEAPTAPTLMVDYYVVDGVTEGLTLTWDNLAESNSYFQFYKVSKGIKRADGSIGWQTLATYYDTTGSSSWPPPAGPTTGTYQLIDPDITNGLIYHYSVQAFTEEITDPIPLGQAFSQLTDEKSYRVISPANPVATETLDNVKVVPNPYIGSAKWNNPSPSDNFPWKHRLQFTNLPADATVKIFTLDGDYVAKVQANKTVIVGESVNLASPSVAEWDLMTRNNQEAAPGIYMYVVESPSLGEKVGKFIIVR
ncbi:MAG TPA: hypothetical protein ENN20_01915 [Candidatus Marinimicrobia bacterium]|nr:hypothetical protein [Candidatus Neomarinimicrobiota bacterium]